jgi:CO/xanthine dehydrogenase Mo-binding subunit
LSYWENGKVVVYGSTQSHANVIPGLSRLVGVKPEDLIYVAEFCGGGFGSKGGAYPLMALSAHFSKKLNRPVMVRVSRDHEIHNGVGRPAFQGRFKVGFAENGKITAVDMFIVQDGGGNAGFGDFRYAGGAISLVYQPEAMRWRGVPVITNTNPRGAQRGPGENQIAMAIEPIMDKAARELGIDRLAIRKLNARTARRDGR